MRIAHSIATLAIVATTLGTARHASAERYGLTAGTIEVLNAPSPSHAAVYANGGGFALFAPSDRLAIIPGLALEYSPDVEAWGVVASCVFDVPIPGTPLGADLVALLLHDQLGGDFANASLYVGGGLGGSWFIDDHWTFSLAWNYYRGVRKPVALNSMGPTAFVSYAW
ncbi:hypothetical protein HY635_03570 [Candidatus Uhrbacteria bacterium]|nr:hypothetical protein [Candidatus Uhrbacteria bacterium]